MTKDTLIEKELIKNILRDILYKIQSHEKQNNFLKAKSVKKELYNFAYIRGLKESYNCVAGRLDDNGAFFFDVSPFGMEQMPYFLKNINLYEWNFKND